MNEICEPPLETKEADVIAELIQILISIGLLHEKRLLEKEVRQFAGTQYKRDGLWGFDWYEKQGIQSIY